MPQITLGLGVKGGVGELDSVASRTLGPTMKDRGYQLLRILVTSRAAVCVSLFRPDWKH